MLNTTAYIKFKDSGNLYFGCFDLIYNVLYEKIAIIGKDSVEKFRIKGTLLMDGSKFISETIDDYSYPDVVQQDCEIYVPESDLVWPAKGNEDEKMILFGTDPMYLNNEEYQELYDQYKDIKKPEWFKEIHDTIMYHCEGAII